LLYTWKLPQQGGPSNQPKVDNFRIDSHDFV
jgi:hypothetical protein